MTGLNTYTLRAESEAALIAMLEEAQAGKVRPFVFDTEDGKSVDASRITFPKPELAPGAAFADPETGENIVVMEPTGMWACEVHLPEPDAVLGLLSG
ncbi:MAG: hypothetical protein LPK88_07540 [Alphaproteobacteria bacterium]|nr:hypothetical protein [Alphaproteobacteria bacterium]MDX5416156.1 hypothetical protein [Alphaproteobacteria bacterium]MDX5493462.1 hypothetical protein [Alphaproteobacteria bacterium]